MSEEIRSFTEGALYARFTSDGRLIRVDPLLGGRARLNIGPANDYFYNDGW